MINPLDNIKFLEKYDRSDIIALLESFPKQCEDAVSIGNSVNIPSGLIRKYKNIVCAGMGGSAIGADIVRSYILDEAAMPFIVNRNYRLPGFVDADTLVIVSSYSGNTEETISAYKDASSRKAKIIAVTSGGKIRSMCEEDGNLCVVIPQGFPPRCALGYSFFPILIVLSKIGIIKDRSEDIYESISLMKELQKNKIGYSIKFKNNIAKKIAFDIHGRYPVIYSSQDHLDAVITRWRGQLAENAKTLSSTNLFPEMNHNEIMGWEYPRKIIKNFTVIMLKDLQDNPRNSIRMKITKDILKTGDVQVSEVKSEKGRLLARLFSLIYIGDMASFYLAILNKRDPALIENIDYLKKELSKS